MSNINSKKDSDSDKSTRPPSPISGSNEDSDESKPQSPGDGSKTQNVPPKKFQFLTGKFRHSEEISKAKKEEHRRIREKSNGTDLKKFRETISRQLNIPIVKNPTTTPPPTAASSTPASRYFQMPHKNGLSQATDELARARLESRQIFGDESSPDFVAVEANCSFEFINAKQSKEECSNDRLNSSQPEDSNSTANNSVPKFKF